MHTQAYANIHTCTDMHTYSVAHTQHSSQVGNVLNTKIAQEGSTTTTSPILSSGVPFDRPLLPVNTFNPMFIF